MFDRQGRWRVTAGAALMLGLLASSALAQVAPTTPPAPPVAPDPMPPNGEPVAAPQPLVPGLANYKAVTAERLKQPEDSDWLMFRRTYDGWGYSPLSQITTDNVGKLHPVWAMSTGQVEGHQAPPMVNNGVMFVATPGNQVLAINAKTGDLLWRFRRPPPEDQFLLHPTSRGVGLWGDKVFLAASDCHARGAGREDRQAGLGNQCSGLREGLLHVAGTAGDRRQGAGRHVGRRTWRSRLTSRPSMPKPARNFGVPTPSPHRASRAARPGRRAISGRPAAVRYGSPASTTRQPT